VLLYLFPGILVGGCHYLLLPVAHNRGYPGLMALMVAVALVLIPFEAGYVIYGSRKTGAASARFPVRSVPYEQ
jgi:hypothetical protein